MQPWLHHLKGEAHAEPGDAIIFRFVRQYPAGINECSHMRGEAIFHAGAGLGEPHFDRIEVATAAAKNVGSQSTFAQRDTQDQIGRSAVYKGSGDVFRISIGANADIPGDKIR